MTFVTITAGLLMKGSNKILNHFVNCDNEKVELNNCSVSQNLGRLSSKYNSAGGVAPLAKNSIIYGSFIPVNMFLGKSQSFSTTPTYYMESDDSGIQDIEPSSPVSSNDGTNQEENQASQGQPGVQGGQNVNQPSSVQGQGGQNVNQPSSVQGQGDQGQSSNEREQTGDNYFHKRSWSYPTGADMLKAITEYAASSHYRGVLEHNRKYREQKGINTDASSSSGIAVGSTAGSSSTSNQTSSTNVPIGSLSSSSNLNPSSSTNVPSSSSVPSNSSLNPGGVTSNASNSLGSSTAVTGQSQESVGGQVQSGVTNSISTENQSFLGVEQQSSPLKRKHSNTELASNKRQDISDSDDDDNNNGKGGPGGFSGGGPGPSSTGGSSGGGPSASSSAKTMLNEGGVETTPTTHLSPIDFVIDLETTTCIYEDLNFWDEII